MKHTPAPWLQSWDCDAPTGSDASPKYDGFEVVDNDGWPIAFIPVHFVFPPVRSQMAKREIDWDEASSNLRLISQAPELLVLAKRVAELNESAGEIGAGMLMQLVTEARAVVKKATT